MSSLYSNRHFLWLLTSGIFSTYDKNLIFYLCFLSDVLNNGHQWPQVTSVFLLCDISFTVIKMRLLKLPASTASTEQFFKNLNLPLILCLMSVLNVRTSWGQQQSSSSGLSSLEGQERLMTAASTTSIYDNGGGDYKSVDIDDDNSFNADKGYLFSECLTFLLLRVFICICP